MIKRIIALTPPLSRDSSPLLPPYQGGQGGDFPLIKDILSIQVILIQTKKIQVVQIPPFMAST
ncbi:MAG: hypothetical protein ACP5I1_03080 [Candidatus Hinthialibacter sp.]